MGHRDELNGGTWVDWCGTWVRSKGMTKRDKEWLEYLGYGKEGTFWNVGEEWGYRRELQRLIHLVGSTEIVGDL